MAKNKREEGNKGEEWAVEYLERNGYEIIERNFQAGHYELDIIAQKNDWLVFVEVKLRGDTEHGYPEENLSKSKQNFLKKAADIYLQQSQWPHKIRFDLIAIVVKPFELMHFEDAFY